MEQLKLGTYSGNVMLSRASGGIIASITSYQQDNFNNAVHYHSNTHFSFALNGGCVERKKEAYEIKPGYIAYYDAGEVHQVIKVPRPTRRVNLEIEPWFFDKYGITDTMAREAIARNPAAKLLMVKISQELLSYDSLSETTIQMLFLQIVAEYRKQALPTNPAWVEKVSAFLHDNSDQIISLDELAKVSNLHPVNISKLFPRYFCCTVGAYKRKLKVENAITLIKSSCTPLTAIAYECGFFDQSHFVRTFKKLTGMLPSDFQKL